MIRIDFKKQTTMFCTHVTTKESHGVQSPLDKYSGRLFIEFRNWIPAFAGMTKENSRLFIGYLLY